MNLLAHALLASAFLPDTGGGEVCGSIMADYFRGERLEDYTDSLVRGILQHRAVDAFTDSHRAFLACRDELASDAPPHAAAILVDLFWDNILGSEWDEFGRPLCGQGLGDFAAGVYRKLESAKAFYSRQFARIAPWLISMDWLSAYARVEGIERVIDGLARRLPHGMRLAGSAKLLESHRQGLEGGLRVFWPDILTFLGARSSKTMGSPGKSGLEEGK
jgi:acyl carrier protein phosphodiesterase